MAAVNSEHGGQEDVELKLKPPGTDRVSTLELSRSANTWPVQKNTCVRGRPVDSWTVVRYSDVGTYFRAAATVTAYKRPLGSTSSFITSLNKTSELRYVP